VVAVGNGITLLGVLRTLHRAAIPAYAITTSHDLARRSRWFRAPPGLASLDLTRERFDAHLEGLPFDEAVVLPCSDDAALQSAALPASLRERFRVSSHGPEAIEVFVDKLRFARAARAAEVPIPLTMAVETDELPDAGLFDGCTSVFLKPRDSNAFLRDFRVKALWVRSREEFREQLTRASERGHQMILQEYVPGPPSNHYFIDGFVDAGGNVTAKLARRRIRMFPSDFGNSTYMKTVALDEIADAAEAIDRIVAQVGYRGMFSAEFKRDERDQRCRMLELNARAWWYVEFAARCGVDVCSMAYLDALGKPVPVVNRYDVGRALVFPSLDFRACRKLRRRGEIGWLEAISPWWQADQPLYSWSDPVPGVSESVRALRASAMRRFKQLLRPSAPGSR